MFVLIEILKYCQARENENANEFAREQNVQRNHHILTKKEFKLFSKKNSESQINNIIRVLFCYKNEWLNSFVLRSYLFD